MRQCFDKTRKKWEFYTVAFFKIGKMIERKFRDGS